MIIRMECRLFFCLNIDSRSNFGNLVRGRKNKGLLWGGGVCIDVLVMMPQIRGSSARDFAAFTPEVPFHNVMQSHTSDE